MKTKEQIKGSIDWLRYQINKLAKGSKTLKSLAERGESSLAIGKMAFFIYDPKYKATLPYYDKFPLTIIVNIGSDYFEGLNVHYLPPKIRSIFLVRLFELLNNDKMNKSTRFEISYKMLKSASKLKYFAPCFKRYLYSHVKSRINIIKPEEWHNAILLPVAKFSGASKAAVWKDSKRKY